MSEKQKARADESEAIFATAQYGDSVETHPFHSHFERPATVEVLPVLAGLHVLDAGCATGWYTEYLALQGAQVTALDLTPAMVEKTQARVPTATVIQADLLEPVPTPAYREADPEGFAEMSCSPSLLLVRARRT